MSNLNSLYSCIVSGVNRRYNVVMRIFFYDQLINESLNYWQYWCKIAFL